VAPMLAQLLSHPNSPNTHQIFHIDKLAVIRNAPAPVLPPPPPAAAVSHTMQAPLNPAANQSLDPNPHSCCPPVPALLPPPPAAASAAGPWR
jgi:hypothetical protein